MSVIRAAQSHRKGGRMLVVETVTGQAVLAGARALGLSMSELVDKLAVPPSLLDEVFGGRREVDKPFASRLSDVLGETPEHWLELEDSDDDGADLVAAWVTALDDFQSTTLQALRARGVVTATRSHPERLAGELAAFFGCPPQEVDGLLDASFRQSVAHVVHADAVSTWLQLANRQAAWLADMWDAPSLNRDALRELLPTLVRVGDQQPTEYLSSVQERLADVGVVLVFQADVKGSRLSGASWPTAEGHSVVALTLRYRFDDYFWWTVFHECAHLLLGHGRVLDSWDPAVGDFERAADALARELLLPPDWDACLTKPSKGRVGGLGAELGVPAGLLVGQLQHARRVRRQDMNALKRLMPKLEELEVCGRRRPSGPEWDQSVATLVQQATTAS